MNGIPSENALLSVVVPCFNEKLALPVFISCIEPILDGLELRSWEMILVDDGSRDGTLGLLEALARRRPGFRYVSFSRNFGKESALLAGLRAAQGDIVCVMAVDLQDPPELLAEMISLLKDPETDCAATRRGEPVFRSMRLALCPNTTAFRRESSAGWGSARCGWNSRMESALPG